MAKGIRGPVEEDAAVSDHCERPTVRAAVGRGQRGVDGVADERRVVGEVLYHQFNCRAGWGAERGKFEMMQTGEERMLISRAAHVQDIHGCVGRARRAGERERRSRGPWDDVRSLVFEDPRGWQARLDRS